MMLLINNHQHILVRLKKAIMMAQTNMKLTC